MRARPAGSPAAPGRFVALDGLRGLAAAVVVVHHVLLTVPGFADAYAPTGSAATGVYAVASYTPLHLLWSGQEAVYVFFVLSGLVLTRPLTRGHRFSWRAYYPKRLLRLYLPVWVALAGSVVLARAVTRTADPDASWWINSHAAGFSWRLVLHDVLLVGPVGVDDTVLWSLRWEVLFSLLLPLYAWVATRLAPGRFLAAKLVVPALVSGVGAAVGSGAVQFLPLFLLGAFLAAEAEAVGALIRRLPAPGLWVGAGLALLALDATWYLVPAAPPTAVTAVLVAVQALGATGLVVLFMCWSPAMRLGSLRAVTALGIVSFSLYLVHEPIVVTTAVLLGPGRVGLTAVVAVPVSLGVAVAFHRWVERPSHRLAQRVGARVAARDRADAEPARSGA